jgi:citrate synthase
VPNTEYAKGLEGVIAAESSICRIDGEQGKLLYYGYSIEDLVKNSTYEEVTYLLLYGELPNAEELKEFEGKMRRSRGLSDPIISMINDFPEKAHPMELLQSVISYLSGHVQHKIQHSATCNCRITLHQIAQLPSVIAAYYRLKNGMEYVPPKDDLSHGGNFLYMMRGKDPDPDEAEIMDKCFILHAEHGFNASTFTARVVASTLSTCYCSISAAVGALYGSLHGGANEKVLAMAQEIGDVSNVVPWLEKALSEKKKVMGMGHRVYRAKDPRAIVMEEFLSDLSEKYGDASYKDILKTLEKEFRIRMEEKGKPIYPNVDFFSGAVYILMGIPAELYTPMFALARSAGWLAHILEQRVDNRLYRPKSLYSGHHSRDFVKIEDR